MSHEIHKNDIGFEIVGNISEEGVAVDVSGATVTLLLKKPSGTTSSLTTAYVTDGTDGAVTYSTVSGDLDEEGLYYFEYKVDYGTSLFYSETNEFYVHENLI